MPLQKGNALMGIQEKFRTERWLPWQLDHYWRWDSGERRPSVRVYASTAWGHWRHPGHQPTKNNR